MTLLYQNFTEQISRKLKNSKAHMNKNTRTPKSTYMKV